MTTIEEKAKLWYVQTSKDSFTNVASFQLFDFDASLPRRELLPVERRLSILESAKQAAIKREDYLRAAKIKDLQNRR